MYGVSTPCPGVASRIENARDQRAHARAEQPDNPTDSPQGPRRNLTATRERSKRAAKASRRRSIPSYRAATGASLPPTWLLPGWSVVGLTWADQAPPLTLPHVRPDLRRLLQRGASGEGADLVLRFEAPAAAVEELRQGRPIFGLTVAEARDGGPLVLTRDVERGDRREPRA